MVPDEDPVRVLEWLARQGHDPAHSLWDSDVMAALQWTEQRTQEALRLLRESGCVTGRNVPLGRGHSIGYLEVTPTGLRRLAEPLEFARRSVILARLRHPLG